MQIGLVRRGWSSSGGAEAYLRRLADALVSSGHSVRLYASDWPSSEWEHGEIVRISGKGPSDFSASFAASPQAQKDKEQGTVFFSMERVLGCHVFRAGDGVHAAWLERRKAFESPWKAWFRKWNRKHKELLALEKQVFSAENTSFVIANSRLVKEEILSRYPYPAEQIAVIPNGYAPPSSSPLSGEERLSLRKKFGVTANAFVALFVGSGWERKGLSFAVRAAGKLPETLLVVAGKGKSSPAYSGKQVLHLGPQRDMEPIYQLADILLQPTWYDPFSNACLEGLAAGLPVITTKDNGFAEILKDGITGSVLSRADAEEEMLRALAFWKNAAGNETSLCCKKSAAVFTPSKNAEDTVRVLEKIRH